ncbi:MAG: tetratricopeptide repeat protein [Treponema sp.]|jgi:tetratricopeptide (TPR) repeat protein|nr:tetratricopeptide repeat protein [Treponema sp.]
MANDEEKKESLSLSDVLVDFIQKNRKSLFIALIGIIVVVIGFVAGLSIRESVLEKAISRVESLNDRYEEIRFNINESEKALDVQALLEDLNANAEKSFGYASARSYALAASIHADQKKWEDAEKAWKAAAGKGGKSYLTPVCLFNAASAAEEYDNIEGAIESYTKVLTYADIFPMAARAQFSIGRLEEGRNNRDAALSAYRAVIEKWPADPVWANFANNRIIVLSNRRS